MSWQAKISVAAISSTKSVITRRVVGHTAMAFLSLYLATRASIPGVPTDATQNAPGWKA